MINQKINYIHANPVKAGLVRIPAHREHPFRFIVSTIPAPS